MLRYFSYEVFLFMAHAFHYLGLSGYYLLCSFTPVVKSLTERLTLHGRRAEATAIWDHLGVCQAEREKAGIEQTQGVTTEIVASASSDRHAPSASQRQDRLVEHKFFDLLSRDVRTRTVLAIFFSWACSNSAE